jgi:uncharacterized protein (TIGR04222 family)
MTRALNRSRHSPDGAWRRLAPIAASALILAVALVIVACASDQRVVQSFGEHTSEQRVYDRVGVLAPAEIADLETRAAAVARAGAPTVVYLQTRDASRDETIQDGRDLMQSWGVESAAGAHDGVVIFVNLQPNNHRHGEAVIVAGQKWNDTGVLTDRENQRIYDEVMAPLLRNEKTAAGIAAGLDAIAHDLAVGPPPPSVWQRIAGFLTGWPLVMLAGLLILALVALIVRSRRWRKKPPEPPGSADLAPPDDLAPALAGALTVGRVKDTQLEATLLDLARRGVIAMEPDGKHLLQIRILQATPSLSGYEEQLFATMREVASPEGVIPAIRIPRLRAEFNPTRQALRDDLVARGWFAQDAGSRRRPLFILATISVIVAAIGLTLAAIAQSPVGIGAPIALFAVAMAAYGFGAAVPDTTAEGELAAGPWRAYQTRLYEAVKRKDSIFATPDWLDRLMPLVVALGLGQAFNPLLKAASATGYAPAWLGWPAGANSAAFFPYWAAFHTSTSGSAGSGGSGAGASAGSSAGGGGF